MKNLLRVFLLVISVSWAAEAQFNNGFQGGPSMGHGGDHGGGGFPGQPGRPPYPQGPGPGQPYPGNPYPGQPGPGQPYPGYGSEVKRIYIGRQIVNETLMLRQLGGIDRSYDGYEVVSVRAQTRLTNSGRTIAQLISDGRVVASQNDPGYQINLMPQYRLVLGQTGNSLQLGIGGGIFIDSIDVELRRDGGDYNPPPPPPYGQNIEINVYRNVMGNDRIDLTQYIDMQRYRGRVIEQVMVTASSRFNPAFIGLMINNFNIGQAQFSGGYSQIATYRLNQQMVIGQGPGGVVLYTQGDLDVEHVTIVVR